MEEDMEHRWNPRKEIDSPVMIYQEQTGNIKASVKNISANGMLVDMGQLMLTKGAIVELAGATMRSIESKMVCLKALIVHANEGLAGLMLIENREISAALWRDFADGQTETASHSYS
jgi:hypothetical protein